MATIRDYIDDIELRIQNVTTSRTIDRRLIKHWLSVALLEEEKDDNDEDEDEDESLLTRFECQVIEEKVDSCDGCEPYFVVPLPVEVNKGGINLVERPGGKVIPPNGGPGYANLISKTQFAPVEFYHRVGEFLYLTGKFIAGKHVHITLTPKSLDGLDEDTELKTPLSAWKVLALVEQVARRTLGTPIDLSNDGKPVTF